jgi:hypothetical protein
MTWLQDYGWVVGVIVALALAGRAWWSNRRSLPANANARGHRPPPVGSDRTGAVLVTLAVGPVAVL